MTDNNMPHHTVSVHSFGAGAPITARVSKDQRAAYVELGSVTFFGQGDTAEGKAQALEAALVIALGKLREAMKAEGIQPTWRSARAHTRSFDTVALADNAEPEATPLDVIDSAPEARGLVAEADPEPEALLSAEDYREDDDAVHTLDFDPRGL